MWRWLRAGFGTRWEAGRWRGGGSDPGQRLPRTDGDWKEQRDNCEGGGTLGANAAASAVPEPMALWDRHSHCSAARSSHAPPLAGKRGVSVTALSPPPTLLHHPMALALSCPRRPPGARTGVTQEGGFAVGLFPLLCFLTGPLGIPAKPRHFWALWGARGAPGAKRRGWRSTQLAGSPFWSAQGCAGGRAAPPALSLVNGIHHLPKTTVPVNNFCFSSPKTPWRNFSVLGWLHWSFSPCLSQSEIPREAPSLSCLAPHPHPLQHPPQSTYPWPGLQPCHQGAVKFFGLILLVTDFPFRCEAMGIRQNRRISALQGKLVQDDLHAADAKGVLWEA